MEPLKEEERLTGQSLRDVMWHPLCAEELVFIPCLRRGQKLPCGIEKVKFPTLDCLLRCPDAEMIDKIKYLVTDDDSI